MKSTFPSIASGTRGLADPIGMPDGRDATPPPSETLARLEDLLWRELDHYRELCDVLAHETGMLEADRPEALPPLFEEETRILEDARDLAPQRTQALTEVSAALGAARALTLVEVAERLEGDERVRLEKLRTALAHIVARVDRINRTNLLLIRNRMSLVPASMHAILEEAPSRTVV